MSRPIWTGSISFGLVNIPIQLQTATREKSVSFHRVTRDGSCRLRQRLYCPETDKEYDFGETAKGIEIGKGEYALVDQKEIDRLKPVKGKSIDIAQFVKLEEIDPIFFDKAYFVTPDAKAGKSYDLLREAMKQDESIALARFVMREKEYLAAIRVYEKGLILHTLHYADEVLVPEGVFGNTRLSSGELQMAKKLIESMTEELDLSQFKDEYREQLEKLVKDKVKGKKTAATTDDEEEDIPPTINLMEALKKSLAGKPTAGGRRKTA